MTFTSVHSEPRLAGLGDHFPTFQLGDRPAFLNADGIADLVAVLLVVRVILLRLADELLVDRMHHAPLHRDDDRLVTLVADHDALQNTLRHYPCSLARSRRIAAGQRGFDARDVAPHLAHASGVLELARGTLEAQIELLLLQREKVV